MNTLGHSVNERLVVIITLVCSYSLEIRWNKSAPLDAQARAMSTNEAAQRLNDARVMLFKAIFNRSKSAA